MATLRPATKPAFSSPAWIDVRIIKANALDARARLVGAREPKARSLATRGLYPLGTNPRTSDCDLRHSTWNLSAYAHHHGPAVQIRGHRSMCETNILAVSRLILRPMHFLLGEIRARVLPLAQLDPSPCGTSDHGQQSRPT